MNNPDIKNSETYKAFVDYLETGQSPHDRDKKRYVVEPTRRGEFHITAYVSDYWMDFECRKAIFWTTPECVGWSGPDRPLYDPKTSDRPSCPTEDTTEAFICMSGFLKWDGCMEVHREEVHTCGAEDVEDEYLCLRRIHQLAKAVMGRWEGDVPRDLCAPEPRE